LALPEILPDVEFERPKSVKLELARESVRKTTSVSLV